MTKLTSLKQKYSDLAKERPAGTDSDEYYPCLYLEGKQIGAMGVDAARVGTEMQMVATVRVSSVNESKGGSRSMSFEIVEAAIQSKKKDPDDASVLFPNG